MPLLHLVRHGQASFGTDDYDRLSALGARQCERLGRHWRAGGQRFGAVLTGTLRRHRQSLEAIAEGLGDAAPTVPVQRLPALDEYDSDALIAALQPVALPAPDSPEAVRQHFRLLRQALARWMAGEITPAGMPTHAEFRAGIAAALDRVRQQHAGAEADVLLVSSGGPISAAVAMVLGAGPEATIDLNMRIRNSALTQFVVTPKRHQLLTFNTLPHLEGADGEAGWVTYA